MDRDHTFELVRQQHARAKILRAVVQQMAGSDHVLKGRSALFLGYDLASPPGALRFDTDKRSDMQAEVRKALNELGLNINGIEMTTDTDSLQGIKIHFTDPKTGVADVLEVKTSFKNQLNVSQINTIDGIKVYSISELLAQKLEMLSQHNDPRDAKDVALILEKYPNHVSDRQWEELASLSADFEEINTNELDYEASAGVEEQFDRADEVPFSQTNVIALNDWSKSRTLAPPQFTDDELMDFDDGVEVTLSDPVEINANVADERYMIRLANKEAIEAYRQATIPVHKLAAEVEEHLSVASNPNVSLGRRQEALGRAQTTAQRMSNAWSKVEHEDRPNIMSQFDRKTGMLTETSMTTRAALQAKMNMPSDMRMAMDGVEDVLAKLPAQDERFDARSAQHISKVDQSHRFGPAPQSGF